MGTPSVSPEAAAHAKAALEKINTSDAAQQETLLYADKSENVKLPDGPNKFDALVAGAPTDIDGDGVAEAAHKFDRNHDGVTDGVYYELSGGGEARQFAVDVSGDGVQDATSTEFFDSFGKEGASSLLFDAEQDGVAEMKFERKADEKGEYKNTAERTDGSVNPDISFKRAGEILRDNFDAVEALGKDGQGHGSGDETVGIKELEQAAKSDKVSPEVRQAVRVLLENKDEAYKADTAANGGWGDVKWSKQDFEKYAEKGSDEVRMSSAKASSVVAAHFPEIDTDNNGLVSRDELEDAKDNDKLPKDLTDALKRLSELKKFDEIDTAAHGGDRDDQFSADDFKAAAKP